MRTEEDEIIVESVREEQEPLKRDHFLKDLGKAIKGKGEVQFEFFYLHPEQGIKGRQRFDIAHFELSALAFARIIFPSQSAFDDFSRRWVLNEEE